MTVLPPPKRLPRYAHVISNPHPHTKTHKTKLNRWQNDYADDFDLNFVPDLPLLGAQYRTQPPPPPPGWNSAVIDIDQPDQPSRPVSQLSTVAELVPGGFAPFSLHARMRPRHRLAPQPVAADGAAVANDSTMSVLTGQRVYRNPISYLGGPLLEPRNRKSLDSMLSVD